MGGCNFGNILPIKIPKCHWGKVCFLIEKIFKAVWILQSGIWSLPLQYGYCWSHEHSHSRKTITAKAVSQLKSLQGRKKLRFALQIKDLALHSLVRTWDIFSVAMLAMKLGWCWEEKDLTNQNLLTTLSAYTLPWYTRTWLITTSLATQRPHCCVASL